MISANRLLIFSSNDQRKKEEKTLKQKKTGNFTLQKKSKVLNLIEKKIVFQLMYFEIIDLSNL